MEIIALSEVTKINMGQSPLSESYNKIGNGLPFFQGKTDFGDVYPKIRVFCTSPNKIAEANDILLSVRAPVGSINICQTKSCIGRGLAAIRATSAIEQKYLYFFLKYYEPELEKAGKGSTFEAVNREDVENIKIPVPSLTEQKRIAAILDKADRLRRQRRYAQTLSDSFLQSIFIKMFGDPMSNRMNWKLADLDSQLKNIDSGNSPVCEEFSRKGTEWAILKLSAVTSGRFLPNENKVLPSNIKPIPDYEVKKDDVLFTRKNTENLIAACALVYETPQRLLLPDTIFRFKLKDNSDVNAEFLWSVFSERKFRKTVQSLATGSAGSMPNISKEKLNSLQIPIPPLPLQEKFAAIVQKFERVRRQQREATRQAEHLFQTLLHRAFRGEL
jgi:type I restriction enzyme S subunit